MKAAIAPHSMKVGQVVTLLFVGGHRVTGIVKALDEHTVTVQESLSKRMCSWSLDQIDRAWKEVFI
jgi:hypothetical protein